MIFRENSQNRQFFADTHAWEGWKSLLELVETWKFNTVYYCAQIVGKLPLIAQKLTLCVLRLLNNVHRKLDYVMKFTKVGQTRFLGVLATWNLVCERKLSPHNRKQDSWVPRSIFCNPSWQNYDVPYMSLFGVKIHKIVNFSKLDSSKQLKMHKSSGSSAICTKLQEF